MVKIKMQHHCFCIAYTLKGTFLQEQHFETNMKMSHFDEGLLSYCSVLLRNSTSRWWGKPKSIWITVKPFSTERGRERGEAMWLKHRGWGDEKGPENTHLPRKHLRADDVKQVSSLFVQKPGYLCLKHCKTCHRNIIENTSLYTPLYLFSQIVIQQKECDM